MASAEDGAECGEGYKAPAQKSLQEIVNLDEDDESLRKYKEQLLGNLPKNVDRDGPNFVPMEMSLVIEGRDDQTFSLDKESLESGKRTLTIKEGCEYQIKIGFRVNYEIVTGQKFETKFKRMGVKLEKHSDMLGSYGPKDEMQKYTTPKEEAPKGRLMRGTYDCESRFIDDDGVEALDWKWKLKIEEK